MGFPEHYHFIRQCYELAREAQQCGDHPFGSLLVYHNEVILTARNRVFTDNDPTAHPELEVARQAGRLLPAAALADCILYSSTEPCVMCCGGIYWSGIGRVVYGCSHQGLKQFADDGFLMASNMLFKQGSHHVEVIGSVLEEEGKLIHASYWGK